MATLTHDGQPVIESSLIRYYLEEGISRPGVAAWWERVRWRRSMEEAIF
jgi:hypothetical protein